MVSHFGRRGFKGIVAAACIVIALSACSTTGSHKKDTSADLAAITAFNARYLKAINDGDIATLSSLTDDDHMMIMANRPPVVGKAANDAANGGGFRQFKIDEAWMPVETIIDGDLGYQRGTFTVAATPKAGGPTRTTTGKFVRIYRRQADGSWRMTRDVLLSDTAAATN
ncbi:MAG: nuclear transport factor 2 family protein [Gammaproteobacteria bacterium]